MMFYSQQNPSHILTILPTNARCSMCKDTNVIYTCLYSAYQKPERLFPIHCLVQKNQNLWHKGCQERGKTRDQGYFKTLFLLMFFFSSIKILSFGEGISIPKSLCPRPVIALFPNPILGFYQAQAATWHSVGLSSKVGREKAACKFHF